ncbi:MAG: hypothetical protein AB7F22_29670 [Reyranella sp.]|uniref:hypothetical protein n=1 Tax=Reyranella sp. TaxID=1929291 RepID=UPI003D0AD7BD
MLSGNEGINTLLGLEGADTVDGGAGADYLLGGVGDDLYRVDDTFDLVDSIMFGRGGAEGPPRKPREGRRPFGYKKRVRGRFGGNHGNPRRDAEPCEFQACHGGPCAEMGGSACDLYRSGSALAARRST